MRESKDAHIHTHSGSFLGFGSYSLFRYYRDYPTLVYRWIETSDSELKWDAESLGMPVQKLNGQVDLQVAASVPPFFASTVNLVGGMGSMANNMAVHQQFASLNKRKSPMGSISSSTSPLMSAAPNKRHMQTEHRPWLQQMAASYRMNMPGEALQKMAVSKHSVAQNKKQSPLKSIPAKSSQQHQRLSPKTQISPKTTSESFKSVRSKMRESLATALALVTQEDGRSPNDAKNSESDISTSADQLKGAQLSVSVLNPQGAGGDVLRESKQKFRPGEGAGDRESSDGQIGPPLGENTDVLVSTTSNTEAFQCTGDFLGEDVSFGDNFFVKDELLQGNGLSWVLEPEEEMVDRSLGHTFDGESSEDASVGGLVREMLVQFPEILASNIEAELFKLFGGVNKKYKEKGRSLLFNLKDRNNPELRQRVVSGEIPPDKLCSMSAEELASKELSEWRMAKAEELAQMVVLPDSEVDVKRLVKKTHKGELQLEVEEDDGLSVEVSARVPIISYGRSQTQEQRPSSEIPSEEKDSGQDVDVRRDSVERNSSFTLTIPSEDQVSEVDIIEEGAMKDLPPIVSLDEFMQSLDSEPPFEDLQVNAGNTESIPEKTARLGSKMRSSERNPKDSGDTADDKSSNLDEARLKSDVSESEIDNARKSSKGDHVWEGSLQLSGSSSSVVSITALFKSGEKTITKDWASCPEVKGRVRLDAFEKFLQGLHLSRSRALMVVHLVRRQSSPKRQQDSIAELADSYVTDERVGITEPCRGVEIYLCPPNDKTRQMLSKVLTEDQAKTLEAVDEGLIGVVVWRRIRPSSSRHTSSSRKPQQQQQRQHDGSPLLKRHAADRDAIIGNSPYNDPRHSAVRLPSPPLVPPVKVDEADAPPGFGPGMASLQEVDDLPEFDFSEEMNNNASISSARVTESHHGHSKTSRSVDHIRELVQKYGQPEVAGTSTRSTGVPIQPWNDDDEDILEWRPASQTRRAPASGIPPVILQQQNLYTYPTTLVGAASRTSQAARQPVWQDPRRNFGGSSDL
ncbi:hypothetical protein MLD38_006397 [Melastoma candidum]|uniref:Uncharacterized protein n=1 Tax=Melastoma candidum TaxID=119954 RepID=A0ACB9RM19_9MYRT|nr:hypothetical protein MLD38_006397 [Melastoma candidum]